LFEGVEVRDCILIIHILVTFELHNHRGCKYWFANVIMIVLIMTTIKLIL